MQLVEPGIAPDFYRPQLALAPTEASSIRVLIAEEITLVRERLARTLAAEDIEVVGVAGTGEELLERVVTVRPHVLLVDVPLPGISPLRAAAAVRSFLPRARLIVATEHKSAPTAESIIRAGAAAYVLRAVSGDSLTHIVRLVAGGGSFVDSRLLVKPFGCGMAAGPLEAAQTLERLTPRERKVLAVLAEGRTNKEIAGEINYSVGTVKNIVQSIIDKLGAADRTQAAVIAVRAGIDSRQEA